MKRENRAFGAFCLMMVALGCCESLRGLFVPVFSRHFALDGAAQGLFITAGYGGNLVFLLLGGPLGRRFSRKGMLLAVMGVWLCSIALFLTTDSFALLLAGMFCMMGTSSLAGTSFNLITPSLYPSAPAFFVNLLFFIQGIGTSGSQLVVGRYAVDMRAWRVVNAVLLVAGAAAMLLLARSPLPEQEAGAQGSQPGGAVPKGAGQEPARRASVLRRPAAWWFILLFGFYFIAEHGFANWLVTYATGTLAAPQAAATGCVALFSAGIMAGRLLLSPLLDRWGVLRCMCLCAGLGVLLYVPGALGGAHTLWLWAASGLFLSILYPTLVMSVRWFYPADEVTAAAGTIISVATLFDIAFNLGFGMLTDVWGWAASMRVLPASAVAFLAVLLLFRRACARQGVRF